MNRREYKYKIKDAFGISRLANDGLLTDGIINETINDAMDKVADDLSLNPTIQKMGLVKGKWQYALPPNVLSVRNLYYLNTSNEWEPIGYDIPENFINYFDEDDQETEPETFSIFGRGSETYRWATDCNLPTNKFSTTSFATSESSSTLICYGANFGLVESGSRIRKGDTVWNNTDDSYGLVDYLDFTTAKNSGTITTATSTRITVSGAFSSAVVGDIIRRTTTNELGAVDNSFAYIVGVDSSGNFVDIEDLQGDTPFTDGDTYTYGTADRIVLQQFGSSSGGLIGGTDNTFEFTDSGHAATAVTLTTTDNSKDTLGGTFTTASISTGMMVIVSGDTDRTGRVRSVSATEVVIDYWIGGPPSGTSLTVTFGTGDVFQIESKFRTKTMLWIKPVPSTDDIGTERLQLMFIPSPTKPDTDDDPIELDDKYRPQLLACMRWLAAEATGAYSQRELANFEAIYKLRLEDSRPISSSPTGQPMTVIPGNQFYRGTVRRYGVRDTWSDSGIRKLV